MLLLGSRYLLLVVLSFCAVNAQSQSSWTTAAPQQNSHSLVFPDSSQFVSQQQLRPTTSTQQPAPQRVNRITTLLPQRGVNRVTSPPPPSQVPPPSFQYDAASFAVTELARLVGAVLGQQANAAVFSPVSIACALSLLLLGAKDQTKNELLQVLQFNPNQQDKLSIHRQYGKMLQELSSMAPDTFPITWRRTDRCSEEEDEEYKPEPHLIHLANAIFVKRDLPLNGRFVEASQVFYNSSVSKLDFENNPYQSTASINRWASENTYGKIDQIISGTLSPDTQMIVANALYFKGLWKEAFEVQATTYRKFYPEGYANPSTAKDVLTMAVIGCFPFYDAVEYDAKIVGLPYQGEKTALYIIIPNNSTRQKLQNFQRNLNAQHIGDMVTKMSVRKALVQLPKMKISNTLNLRDILQKLNLRSIFNPSTSNLSSMLDPNSRQFDNQQQRLYASEIIHKVELDINEKGTEGGAITASTIFRSLPSVQVRIDTPFLMLLGHDNTRLPLFYGNIYDPTG